MAILDRHDVPWVEIFDHHDWDHRALAWEAEAEAEAQVQPQVKPQADTEQKWLYPLSVCRIGTGTCGMSCWPLDRGVESIMTGCDAPYP